MFKSAGDGCVYSNRCMWIHSVAGDINMRKRDQIRVVSCASVLKIKACRQDINLINCVCACISLCNKCREITNDAITKITRVIIYNR